MAWREVAPMEERIRFVLQATREEGDFTALCGSSASAGRPGTSGWRGTGRGLDGCRELSGGLGPARRASRPRWRPWCSGSATGTAPGAEEAPEILGTKYGITPVPAVSTIGNLLTRQGLTRKTRRRRPVSAPDRRTRTAATHPMRCGPRTSRVVPDPGWPAVRSADDQRPRQPVRVGGAACGGPQGAHARPVFRQVFRRFGLPEVLRVDNGPPFGARGVCGLSPLSAWWLHLGIRVEFLEPGHPEQNGAHERMHRTLKADTARPRGHPRAQQARFDRWRHTFNTDRPHEALGMQRPAERYHRSGHRYTDHPRPLPTRATTRSGG